MGNSKRLDYLDIAKGLAMFCVIAGHMGVVHVNAFVFSFHMPLFFLVSGYFYKADGAKVLRNSGRLLTAYCWTVVAVLVLSEAMTLAQVLHRGDDLIALVNVARKWIVAGLYGSGARVDFFCFRLPAIGAVWFLLAMIWGGWMLLVINKLRKDWQQMAAVVSLFLAGWFTTKWTWLPWSVQSGMCATLFMFIGYKARKYNEFEIRKVFFPASVLIWGVALYSCYIAAPPELSKCFFPNVVINVAGGVTGTYVVVCVCRWIERVGRGAVYRYMLFWGRNTLVVLCAHLTELNCVPWSKVYSLIDSRPIGLIVVFCLKVLWATLAVLLVNKYKDRNRLPS